jgi:putative (di)nucleoside polyphosphate hydrolase
MTDNLYRRGVGAMIINTQNKVFVGRRIDQTVEAWQMPQGGIDKHEDPDIALWREVEEETGIHQQYLTLEAESKDWLTYDFPAEIKNKVCGGKYIGQQQKWYVLRFSGPDAVIDLDAHEPAEFSAWQWVIAQDVPKLIVPFKRDLYAQVLAEFDPYL